MAKPRYGFSGSDARAAMGAKANDNPYHHDRPAAGELSPAIHASSHGDGGSDVVIEVGAVEPGSPFPGMIWVDTS